MAISPSGIFLATHQSSVCNFTASATVHATFPTGVVADLAKSDSHQRKFPIQTSIQKSAAEDTAAHSASSLGAALVNARPTLLVVHNAFQANHAAFQTPLAHSQYKDIKSEATQTGSSSTVLLKASIDQYL
ncbi:MAG: hypothetical protein MK207_14920 [Saprospiraceae bacterium]|uniref:hypothetical protein n=1 Tax=Kordia sp. TaxID=1965332 RepID=UPI0025BCC900|nr:hypothetical protein [Kordia sp.]MCH2023766.1 hypothetical protein [Saprospiraceae bacterium]MCH2196532.1 hypothetical protein [Kordia sp.]